MVVNEGFYRLAPVAQMVRFSGLSTTPSSASGGATSPSQVISGNLRRAFLKSLVIPLCTLVFFACAPAWLNYRVHSGIEEGIRQASHLSPIEQEERIAAFAGIDFGEVCRVAPPGLEGLRADLKANGLCTQFERLDWSFRLSVLLVAILLAVMGATRVLNRRAQKSRDALIRAYRTGWRLGMAAAITKVVLLVPLLAFGIYELTTLAFDRYYPQAILGIVIVGGVVLWRSGMILLKPVPMEFAEPLSREIGPEEAPEFWQAVREAAARLKTQPPDRIVVGMQLNFYVTELAVIHGAGRAEGRTLFISQPLLRQLSADEVLAIIGHELAHFMGEDTRITREFYPLRFKVNATMMTLAQSIWVGWPSLHALGFFTWAFGATEQAVSRERELLADRTGAELTSPETMARALVKLQVVNEAFHLAVAGPGRRPDNPFEAPLGAFIREELVPKAGFWTQLFEKTTPHPLDSHPALHVRLEALGRPMGAAEAITVATEAGESAYQRWFSAHDGLFATLAKEAADLVEKVRARTDAVSASYQTEDGRRFLEANFPVLTWKVRAFTFWFMMGACALAVLGLGAVAVFGEGGGVKTAFGLLAAATAVLAAALWKRHRNGVFVLDAEGLSYTGWHRKLLFSSVEGMTALRSNGTLTGTFVLKAPEPGIWKYNPLRYRRRTVSVGLNWIAGKKQDDVLQTLHRYLTRQLPPEEPSSR